MSNATSVSSEQISRAKKVEILDYLLAQEPENIVRSGKEYRLRDHDSLTISNGMWNWRSRGFGCKTATALNFLIEVRGYSFVDAVLRLSGDMTYLDSVSPNAKPPPTPKPFILPPENRTNNRVIAYLQSRGIAKPLIAACLERGDLYESAQYHNCVFIGRDIHGNARFASMRGTFGTFRCDVEGSDKRYGFVLPPAKPGSSIVAVFESAIDALSHQMLFPEFDGWRLSLDGTSLVALTHFLECHPEISDCIICTDNDKAGNLAAVKIAKLEKVSSTRSLPHVGKDWNKTLLALQRTWRSADSTRFGGVPCR